MPSDIEIAQAAKLKRISQVAKDKLGIAEEHLEPYGHYKAKVSLPYVDSLKGKPNGKLVLVTAISPTPAGEGKTTTTVGLGDALNYIGKKAVICLREPSLGPVFGVKGGAVSTVGGPPRSTLGGVDGSGAAAGRAALARCSHCAHQRGAAGGGARWLCQPERCAGSPQCAGLRSQGRPAASARLPDARDGLAVVCDCAGQSAAAVSRPVQRSSASLR